MSGTLLVRLARPSDGEVLLRALALAADWRPGTPVRSLDVLLATPQLAQYVPDLTRGRDQGVVAEVAGQTVGAAWWRFLTAEDPGYGFVSEDVPEICLGVEHPHRGHGVGTALMTHLVGSASEKRLPGLSLSVEPDNPAVRLYRRLGFRGMGTDGGAETMLLRTDAG